MTFKKTDIAHSLYYTSSIKTKTKECKNNELAAYDIQFKKSNKLGSLYIWQDNDEIYASFEFESTLDDKEQKVIDSIKTKITTTNPEMIFSQENLNEPIAVAGDDEEDEDDKFIEIEADCLAEAA